MFLICFFMGWVRDVFCVFRRAYPPTQCRGWPEESGHSFVAQDAFPELWAGLRWFLAYSWRIPCYFPSRSWYSLFAFPLNFLALPHVAGGMAMAFADDLSMSLRCRPSFLSLFLTYLVGFVASPFRGVGVDFEEPHLRLMF